MKKCVFILFLWWVQAPCQTAAGPANPGQHDLLFDRAPRNVPTPKTPDAPLAGNGDIGIVMGGAPDSLAFYLGKNDFWRAYPVYPGGGIALPGGLTLLLPDLGSASYHARERMDKAVIDGEFDKDSYLPGDAFF